jgi:hypothetical protein
MDFTEGSEHTLEIRLSGEGVYWLDKVTLTTDTDLTGFAYSYQLPAVEPSW